MERVIEKNTENEKKITGKYLCTHNYMDGDQNLWIFLVIVCVCERFFMCKQQNE